MESDETDDEQLIKAVQDGDVAAFGQLYERHVEAAYNLARQISRSAVDADDLVAEAFTRVFIVLLKRRGPESAFRAYLLTALRNKARDIWRKNQRIDLTSDFASDFDPMLTSAPFNDSVTKRIDQTLVDIAFARLPERWQAALWHVEIEGKTPAEVAPTLGLTANGVSALAYRAREALRQAYLQAHLAEARTSPCEPTVNRLGAWTRNGLSKRESRQVQEHLDICDSCRTLSVELAEISSAFHVGSRAKCRRGTGNRSIIQKVAS